MFKTVHLEAGINAAYIYCDICQERIVNAVDGLAFYNGDTSKIHSSAEIIHVHKGKCDQKAQAKIGDQNFGSQELAWNLLQVIYNSGLTLEKLAAVQQAHRDENISLN
jgi:hypothetical protein